MTSLVIGCRTTQLAVVQTEQAGEYIVNNSAATGFALEKMITQGDKIKGNLASRGGNKGLFVIDVENALREGRINLAIHCLKDVPGDLPVADGLVFAGYLPREDSSDVLIAKNITSIEGLPNGATLGTSSPRRAAQVLAIRPDLRIDRDYRGAITSRRDKVLDGKIDATILAAAGLNRIGDHSFDAAKLDQKHFIPAIGQGTLVIQCRASDNEILAICSEVTSLDAQFASVAERTLLSRLDGNCHSAIAGHCQRAGQDWILSAGVYEIDGTNAILAEASASQGSDPEVLGNQVAEELLSQGAQQVILRHRKA